MPLVFTITITVNRESKNYVVRHKPINDREECFFVERENEKWLVRSNRPLIRKYAKRRRPDFDMSFDSKTTWSFIDKVCDAIWNHIKEWEKTSPNL